MRISSGEKQLNLVSLCNTTKEKYLNKKNSAKMLPGD